MNACSIRRSRFVRKLNDALEKSSIITRIEIKNEKVYIDAEYMGNMINEIIGTMEIEKVNNLDWLAMCKARDIINKLQRSPNSHPMNANL